MLMLTLMSHDQAKARIKTSSLAKRIWHLLKEKRNLAFITRRLSLQRSSVIFRSVVAAVLSSSSSHTFVVCQYSDPPKAPQVKTKTHCFTQHSPAEYRTTNCIHDPLLTIIFISLTSSQKEKWRSLSGDGLNEALLTTTDIPARLRNRQKPGSAPVLVRAVRDSGWLTWNGFCSDPKSWHLQWQSEGGGGAGKPPSCFMILPGRIFLLWRSHWGTSRERTHAH